MSVAPDIAPDVIIPARARRRLLDRSNVAVDGPAGGASSNVIRPLAFQSPQSDGDAVPAIRRLRAVPAGSMTSPVSTPTASEAAGLRITARGRKVLALAAVLIGVAIAAGSWFSVGASGSAAPSAPAGSVPAQLVVHDGDTLWSIASGMAPGRDPRATVDQLVRLNHLDTSSLQAGQVLRLR